MHQEKQFRPVVVAVFASEQSAENWNVLEDRHARLLGAAIVFNITAQHDGLAIADGKSGGGMAARCRGHIVVVNFNEAFHRADVLIDIQHHQAVRGDEGSDLELHADLDLLDRRTRTDPRAIPVVGKTGDIRHR